MGWKRRRTGGTSSVLQRLSQQYPNFFIVPTTFLCGHSAHHIFLTTLLYSHKLPAFPLLWSVNVIFMELKRFCQMSKLFGCVKWDELQYDMICSQNWNRFIKHSNNVFVDRKLNIKSQSMADLKFNQFMARVVDVISKWKSRQMRRRIPYQWFTKNIPP